MMATLAEILGTFLDDADELEGTALKKSVIQLATDAATLVADHTCGEIPALLQRASVALAWIIAETKDPDDRQNRRGRLRAVLDLADLCEAIRVFHAGKGDDDHLAAMREEISAALRPFVDAGDA